MADVLSNLQKLPHLCAGTLATTGETILIKRGVSGYWPAPKGFDGAAYNQRHEITPRQVAAMEYGSLFGWDIPLADPDCDVHDHLR